MISLRKKTDNQVNILLKRLRYIVLKQARNEDYKRIDLHYLFLEEAKEVILIFADELRNNLIRTSRKGFFQTEIITGKGIHSKNSTAVLFPEIKKFLKDIGHQIVSANDGKIICNIKM